MGGYLGTYSSTSSSSLGGGWGQALQQQHAQLGNYNIPTGTTATYIPVGPGLQGLVGGGVGSGVGLPATPTGPILNFVSVYMVDANGNTQSILVDPMAVQHINLINQIHAMLRGMAPLINPPTQVLGSGYMPPAPPAPITKMVDSDFTLDEMAEAEKILEEMGA